MQKIRLGVSSCLLGNPVRYDGGHKRNACLCDQLGLEAEYVPVCPELECGLPVPREPIQLEGNPADPRLMTVDGKRDLTGVMQTYIHRRLEELAAAGLDGFVFKKNSPSCGLADVKIFDGQGIPAHSGRGMFANAFLARFPELPVIEEDMLDDRRQREHFLASCRRRQNVAE